MCDSNYDVMSNKTSFKVINQSDGSIFFIEKSKNSVGVFAICWIWTIGGVLSSREEEETKEEEDGKKKFYIFVLIIVFFFFIFSFFVQ